jgi:hypothetical protein
MIKNFTELKKQLQELSAVINSFKSEAVQLRIVELVLQDKADDEGDGSESEVQRTRRRKRALRPERIPAADDAKRAGKRLTAGKKGPATILGELIEEGFFQSKRTINAIIEYASAQKARIFKASELSGPLARFVRDKRLKRQKNADGQYEYHK